jgi:uncharacterized alpha/beta hydrolase family protein
MKTFFIAITIALVCSVILTIISVGETISHNKKEKTEQTKTTKVVKTKKTK